MGGLNKMKREEYNITYKITYCRNGKQETKESKNLKRLCELFIELDKSAEITQLKIERLFSFYKINA